MAKINIHIIERNITGCATGEEQSVLYSWLERDQANRDAYFRMKNIRDCSCIKGYSCDTIRREWKLLAKRLNTGEAKPQPVVRRVPIMRRWMRYAAVFAVAAGLGWSLKSLLQSTPETETEQIPAQTAWHRITVPNGHRTQVVLSDGSIVWLNAGTTLQYPSDFGVHNRQVILCGEASFRIAPSDVPFAVSADEVEVTVLGTHFNVRNYLTDIYVETALFEGSVKLKTSDSDRIMNSGSVATYRKDRKTTDVKQMANIADKFAWNNNHLIIGGERLEDIARTLERRYDVRITIADDDLKEYRYTGKFVYNETIRQVLKVISLTTKMQYKVAGNEITISK